MGKGRMGNAWTAVDVDVYRSVVLDLEQAIFVGLKLSAKRHSAHGLMCT